MWCNWALGLVLKSSVVVIWVLGIVQGISG